MLKRRKILSGTLAVFVIACGVCAFDASFAMANGGGDPQEGYYNVGKSRNPSYIHYAFYPNTGELAVDANISEASNSSSMTAATLLESLNVDTMLAAEKITGTVSSVRVSGIANLKYIRGESVKEIHIGAGVKALKADSNFSAEKVPMLENLDFSDASDLETISGKLIPRQEKIKSIDLSGTKITVLGGEASNAPFSESYLESITLPKTLTTLGDGAIASTGSNGDVYHDWQELKTLVLPDSVKCVESGAFSGQKSLKTIYVPSTVNKFGSGHMNLGGCYTSGSQTRGCTTAFVVYPGENCTYSDATEANAPIAKTQIADAKLFEPATGRGLLYPAQVVCDADALSVVSEGEDGKEAVATVESKYLGLGSEQKSAPVLKDCWIKVEAQIENAWSVAAPSGDRELSVEYKLAQVEASLKAANEAKASAEAAEKVAREKYSNLWSQWDAATNSVYTLSYQKTKLEAELKEAKTKLEEAQAKVEEAQSGVEGFQEKLTALQAEVEKEKAKADESQKKAEETQTKLDESKAKVVALQDKLAVSALKGEVKTAKLNKKGKTGAKATIKVKLATSESGAAVACAKAKGTSKGVSVSKAGVITLAKGSKKGTYKAVVTFTCGKASKTVTYTFKAA